VTHPEDGTSRGLVASALVAVQIFFGFHYIGAKIILAYLPPLAWATIRILGAVAIIVPVVLLSGKRWPRSLADHGRLALYALFGVAINQTCFVEGLSRTVPSHSSLINTMIPVATLAIALAMKRERATAPKLWGIALALGGVGYLMVHSGTSFEGTILTGDVLTLINAVSFSFFLVISKPILARYSSAVVTAMLLVYGSVIITTAGLWDLVHADFSAVPAKAWWCGLAVILFPTVAAYGLNAWALKRVDSSLVALFIYVQPVIGSGLSVLLLGEKLTPGYFVAAAFVFAGVFVALIVRPSATEAAAAGA